MNPNPASSFRPAAATRVPEHGGAGQEFLAFKLGDQEYGFDILRVREIRSYERPLRVANAPAHLLGMLNLRGAIVPIVDLRIHFGLAEARFDTVTITVLLQRDSHVVGVVVDAVSDVLALTAEELRPLPDFGSAVSVDQLMAIGVQGGRTLALLDVDKLLASPALGLARTTPLQ